MLRLQMAHFRPTGHELEQVQTAAAATNSPAKIMIIIIAAHAGVENCKKTGTSFLDDVSPSQETASSLRCCRWFCKEKINLLILAREKLFMIIPEVIKVSGSFMASRMRACTGQALA